MSNVARILMSRRLNKAFMNYDPLEIVLTRKAKVDTGAGGWKWAEPTNLEPQLFRMTPFKRRLGLGETNTPDGDITASQFLLMGKVGADVAKGDTFKVDNDNYIVVKVHPKELTRLMAVVEWVSDDSNAL